MITKMKITDSLPHRVHLSFVCVVRMLNIKKKKNSGLLCLYKYEAKTINNKIKKLTALI